MDILDAPEQLGATASMVWTWSVEFLPRLTSAVLIAVAGYLAAHYTSRLVASLISKTERLDPTFTAPIAAVVRYAIMIFVFVAALSQLGIQTASILAALGAAGLAIGLALQGTLSNIAAGLMLLWLRPFRAGERIDAGGIIGTVREIGLFATVLDTADGLFHFIPNSQLWNRPLLNYTRNPSRQLEIKVPVGKNADLEKAREILTELAGSDRRIKGWPTPSAGVAELRDNGSMMALHVWTASADFGAVHRELLEKARRSLDEAGIPYPQA